MGTKATTRRGRTHRLPKGAEHLIGLPREELDRRLEAVGVIDRDIERQRFEAMFAEPEPEFELGTAFAVRFRQMPEPIMLAVVERRIACNPVWGKTWEYRVSAEGLPEGYSPVSKWLTVAQINLATRPRPTDLRTHPCADCG